MTSQGLHAPTTNFRSNGARTRFVTAVSGCKSVYDRLYGWLLYIAARFKNQFCSPSRAWLLLHVRFLLPVKGNMFTNLPHAVRLRYYLSVMLIWACVTLQVLHFLRTVLMI
jgi:hypothetical protein